MSSSWLPGTALSPRTSSPGLPFRDCSSTNRSWASTYALLRARSTPWEVRARLYTINPTTGQATQIGGGPFSPVLSGANFGIDFNPVVDLVRIVSNTDQNLRLNPNTGLITSVDVPLAYAVGDPNTGSPANVISAAYTNSFTGATTTTLYGLDSGLDVLVIQNPPNNGQLITVGSLGIDAIDVGGFDISGATGTAYAVLFDTEQSRSIFATINLTTGAASFIGEINGGTTITAMTVVPEPAGVLLLVVGLASSIRSRKRR